ncbi:hypothetical protein QQF64_035586 [Cirrhinus molitorella]|uniref:Uncharacterized protein n=1 Tax=Cirrhinus molitorella TaxID=172907 RepID=A0ABR3NGY9_9TELE
MFTDAADIRPVGIPHKCDAHQWISGLCEEMSNKTCVFSSDAVGLFVICALNQLNENLPCHCHWPCHSADFYTTDLYYRQPKKTAADKVRSQHGEYHRLVQELWLDDVRFQQYFRTSGQDPV